MDQDKFRPQASRHGRRDVDGLNRRRGKIGSANDRAFVFFRFGIFGRWATRARWIFHIVGQTLVFFCSGDQRDLILQVAVLIFRRRRAP